MAVPDCYNDFAANDVDCGPCSAVCSDSSWNYFYWNCCRRPDRRSLGVPAQSQARSPSTKHSVVAAVDDDVAAADDDDSDSHCGVAPHSSELLSDG